MRQYIALSFVLLVISAQSLEASNYQILSNQQNVPVINLLEYDICQLEIEKSLIQSRNAKIDLENLPRLSFKASMCLAAASFLLFIDMAHNNSRVSGVFGGPAMLILSNLSALCFCVAFSISGEKYRLEKIDSTIKTIKEQIAVHRLAVKETK